MPAQYDRYLAEELSRMGFPDIKNYRQTEMTPRLRTELSMALDAQPVIGGSNQVPVWATAYFFPEVLEVFTSPLSAEKILNVRQIGDWTTPLAVIETEEVAGRSEPYGDFSRDGSGDVSYAPREMRQYRFQTMMYYGDLEAAIRTHGGAYALDLVARKEAAAAKVINKGHNDIWLYGVEGTEVYGLINHPHLLPAISPKNVGGKLLWEDKTADEIVDDVDMMYMTLVNQSGGVVTEETPLRLVLSSSLRAQLNRRREHTDRTAFEMIQETYPALTIVTAPEYNTASGNMIQLIAQRITDENGVEHETVTAGYSLRIQGHGKIRDVSSTVEKKSAGNWGTAVWYPFAVVTLLGA